MSGGTFPSGGRFGYALGSVSGSSDRQRLDLYTHNTGLRPATGASHACVVPHQLPIGVYRDLDFHSERYRYLDAVVCRIKVAGVELGSCAAASPPSMISA